METNRTSNQRRLKELSSAPVGRLMLRYSIPSIVGIVVMQLYNIVDRVFIGQVVGSDAIAGLAITFPVINIATALGVLIGAGASSRVSILLGSDHYSQSRRVAGNALTLTLAIGLTYITVFALYLNPLLELFGATEETLPYARDLILWQLPGLLLTNIAFSFNNVMRASGFPGKAMITMFIGALVNIGLDPIFIYCFGWGIKGAAIATDIAMAVSAVFVMAHFVKPHGEVYFARGNYSLHWATVRPIIAIGAAPCIVNVAGCLINVLINRSLYAYGGAGAIAAAGVFVTATSFVCAVIIGLTQGMQPIVGFNYGAGEFGRLRRAYIIACGAATVVCAIGWGAGMLFPEAIARAFLREPQLVTETGRYLSIAMTLFWMVGFQIVSTVLFQAIGKAVQSIFLSMIRQVIFLIPLLLTLPRFYGLNGVWASFPVSDALATIVTASMVWWQLRHLAPKALRDN